MSAWWGRKCSNNKGRQQQQVVYHDSLHTHLLNLSKSSTKNDNTKGKDKEMPTSLVNDFDGCSVFSGFDSDSGDRSDHPLPRRSTSFLFWCCCCPTSSVEDHIAGTAVGMGSRSGSFSSVSSSWSSDDQSVSQENCQFGDFRYELSRVTALLFIAMGTRKLHCRSESRSGLSPGMVQPNAIGLWLAAEMPERAQHEGIGGSNESDTPYSSFEAAVCTVYGMVSVFLQAWHRMP